MSRPQPKPRFQPRNLLGILSFLRPYPGRVALCFGLLLVNIAIEMTLPQILGNAITGLREYEDSLNSGPLATYARTIDLGAGTLTVGVGDHSTSFAGAITGAGGLIKTGAGTHTLSGAR